MAGKLTGGDYEGRETGSVGNGNAGFDYNFGLQPIPGYLLAGHSPIPSTIGISASTNGVTGSFVSTTKNGETIQEYKLVVASGLKIDVALTHSSETGYSIDGGAGVGFVLGKSFSVPVLGSYGTKLVGGAGLNLNSDGTGFLGFTGSAATGGLLTNGSISGQLGLIIEPYELSGTGYSEFYQIEADKLGISVSDFLDPRGYGGGWGYLPPRFDYNHYLEQPTSSGNVLLATDGTRLESDDDDFNRIEELPGGDLSIVTTNANDGTVTATRFSQTSDGTYEPVAVIDISVNSGGYSGNGNVWGNDWNDPRTNVQREIADRAETAAAAQEAANQLNGTSPGQTDSGGSGDNDHHYGGAPHSNTNNDIDQVLGNIFEQADDGTPNGGGNGSGDQLTTGDFESSGGSWTQTNNGPSGTGTPNPSLPENPDYNGVQPIVLDLDGDGIETSLDFSAAFDFDGDGFRENGVWAAADDGFLVIDLNSDGSRGIGDGLIDQQKELVLSTWAGEGATDLEALATAVDKNGNKIFDTNNDGLLTAEDTSFDEFRVWQDLNQDGVTDRGELKRLNEVGITQINLTYDNGTSFASTDDDVAVGLATLKGRASFVMNGDTIDGGVGDLELAFAEMGSRQVDFTGGFRVVHEVGFSEGYRWLTSDERNFELGDEESDWVSVVGNQYANILDASRKETSVFLDGGDGNDVLRGGSAADILDAGQGNDKVSGGDGNDLIVTGKGKVKVYGGDGNDNIVSTDRLGTFDGGEGVDTISFADSTTEFTIDLLNRGGNGGSYRKFSGIENVVGFSALSSTIYGNLSANELWGGSANDKLFGEIGDDILHGGKGNDRLYGGAGNDLLEDTGGRDTFFGGAGFDTVSYQSLTKSLTINLETGTNNSADKYYGIEAIVGSGGGDDTISGNQETNMLMGAGGDDTLDGRDGNDFVFGDHGNDKVYGGNGTDEVSGGVGSDAVYGGAGADRVSGEDGSDKLYGGSGDDRLYGNNDTDTLYGGDGDDTLDGGNGDDVLKGGAGADLFDYDRHEERDRIVDFENNIDTIQLDGFEALFASSDYALDNYATNVGDDVVFDFGGGDSLTVENTSIGYLRNDLTVANAATSAGNSIELQTGTIGNDTLEGTSNASFIFPEFPGDGDGTLDVAFESIVSLLGGTIKILGKSNALHGLEGDDRLVGSVSDDFLYGGEDDDRLYGDIGDDYLIGGDGDDYLRNDGGSDVIDGGQGTDTLSYWGLGREIYVSLATGANSNGDTLSNIENVYGTQIGDDELFGDDGANIIKGLKGDDKLGGQEGDDSLYGGDGADRIFGNNGEDYLSGGAGDDYLDGGHGADVLRGGVGSDTFKFDRGEDSDRIVDFENNVDLIVLKGFDFTDVDDTMARASQVGNDVYFDFGNGDELTVKNVSVGQLTNDLILL